MKSLLTAVCCACFWPFKQEARHFIYHEMAVMSVWLPELYSTPPLYCHDADAQSVHCSLLLPPLPRSPAPSSSTVPPLSPLSGCMRFAEAMHISSASQPPHCVPVWPAGTRRSEASPLGSAALEARSKACSRARPWREPCCRPTGWWREKMIW